jgi:hypothetical protein
MGKTKRDYGLKTTIHNIVSMKPYNREKIHQLYNELNIRNVNGKIFTEKKYGDGLLDYLPTKYLWELENNAENGCQILSNLLNKPINLLYENTNFTRESHLLITNTSLNSETVPNYYIYAMKNPRGRMFNPKELNNESQDVFDEDIINYLKEFEAILIYVRPKQDHYSLTCEHRKRPNQSCQCCFMHNGRIYLKKGTGNKSSQKTKGHKSGNMEYLNDLINEQL